jgi:hypothetical protein
MSTFPLQLVLLIAVVTSQVLGGNSCCCLERAMFSFFVVDGSKATDADRRQETSPDCQQRPTGTCPKCSVRKGNAALPELEARKLLPCHQSQVGEDGQCRCAKLVINATIPGDQFSSKLVSPAWSMPFRLESRPEREVDSLLLRNYEVPVRFGGHSWLSVACTWKN